MDTWPAIDAERSALVADLATLTDDQWNAQSLCAKWRVRDVVGHLIFGSTMTTGQVFGGMIASGFNFHRSMEKVGRRLGAEPTDVLIAQYTQAVGSRHTLKGAPPVITLVDTVCHGMDIRRPLGLSRVVPVDALTLVATTMTDIGFPLQIKKRIEGVQLTATDAAWTSGAGPVVEGPLSSLVLAMGGRPSALDDLAGDGLARLRERVLASR